MLCNKEDVTFKRSFTPLLAYRTSLKDEHAGLLSLSSLCHVVQPIQLARLTHEPNCLQSSDVILNVRYAMRASNHCCMYLLTLKLVGVDLGGVNGMSL